VFVTRCGLLKFSYLFKVHWTSWKCRFTFFIKVWKFSTIIISNILTALSFSCSSEYISILDGDTRPCSFFFSLCALYCSDWIILNDLLTSLLILSFACSNLLLSCSELFIFITIHLISEILFDSFPIISIPLLIAYIWWHIISCFPWILHRVFFSSLSIFLMAIFKCLCIKSTI
jgi:hypothetical protein